MDDESDLSWMDTPAYKKRIEKIQVQQAIDLLESLNLLTEFTQEATDGERLEDYYGIKYLNKYRLEKYFKEN